MTYSLQRGIKKFGKKDCEATLSEMQKLHDRECFKPINIKDVTESEHCKEVRSLLFLVDKRDGRIKTRHFANGKPQRQWLDMEDVSSPTVGTESTHITSVIDDKEWRDVVTCDVANMDPTDKHGDQIIIRIIGSLVDILCALDNVYNDLQDIVLYTCNNGTIWTP